MRQFTYLLFDLGGVLVDWDDVTPLLELTDNVLTPEQARRFWLESVWVRKFETGQCTAEAFAQGVVAELHVAITPQQFLTRFASWDTGPFPGASTLLKALQPRFTLACLSNNNPIHWSHPRLQRLLPLFHACFVSFETGVMKPDRAAFFHAITQMRAVPADMLFFDDNPECVQTACELGVVARQVQGLQAVQHTLQEFGIVV